MSVLEQLAYLESQIARLKRDEAPIKPRKTGPTCNYEPCSRPFISYQNTSHRFCSEKCRCRSAYLRRTRGTALAACRVCGHEFVRRRATKVYCSDTCFELSHNRTRASTKAKVA